MSLERAAAEEMARRTLALKEARLLSTSIYGELFEKQLAVVKHPSKYKAAITTRRAGKTNIWSRYAVVEALSNQKALIRIWAISRLRAKQLLWQELLEVCARHKVQYKENQTELSIKFSNGSEIRLCGADKDSEVQKKRGDKTWLEVVLEAQLYGPMLKQLAEDVVDPCLMDERFRGGGIFCLEGTPGPVCHGYWYDVSGRENTLHEWDSVGDVSGSGAGWRCFHWSVLDNPYMPHAKSEVAKLKAARRWTDESPTYVREWLGRWVVDDSVLYYAYNEDVASYLPANKIVVGPGWNAVLGMDVGWNDAMAITVWAWHDNERVLYEAESWAKSHVLSDDVVAQIREYQRKYNIVRMVADTGGAGRLYVEELQSRFGLTFESAKKTEKWAHVCLFNDDMNAGRVKLKRGGELAGEMSRLPRDPDSQPGKPPVEHPGYENHRSDSCLYSWRFATHFLSEPKVIPPAKGTEEYNSKREETFLASIDKPPQAWFEADYENPDYL